MNKHRKRKSSGTWLYSVYRRTRYLLYLRKVRKIRRKQQALEEKREAEGFQLETHRQINPSLRDSGSRRNQAQREQKLELARHKAAAKAHRRSERIKEKHKRQIEKAEHRELKRQARQAVRSKNKEERELERHRKKNQKEELRNQRLEVKMRLREKAILDRALHQEQKRQRQADKLRRKSRLRQLRPYLFKRRMREIVRGMRSLRGANLLGAAKWVLLPGEDKIHRNQFLKITANSLALFVLSYFSLMVIGEMITLYAAQTFDYNTILFYYKIYYNIDADQWTADAVKIMYSIRPVTGLVLGSIAIVIYSTIKNDHQVFKLYFLWLFVHGMIMFFGSLLMGTLLNQGFGWVIAYLYYKDTGKMVFSIVAIFALVVTGTAISRSFLISGNAYFNFINRENRKFLLVSQVVLPALLGTAVISFMKVPVDFYYTTTEEVLYEIFKVSSILIVLIPLILSFSSFTTVFFDEEPRKIKLHWAYIVITFLFLWGYRYFLMNGLSFTA